MTDKSKKSEKSAEEKVDTKDDSEEKVIDDFHYSKTLKRMVQLAVHNNNIDLGEDKKYFSKISDKTVMACNFYRSIYIDQGFPAPKSPSQLDAKDPKFTKLLKAWDMYTLGKEAYDEVENNKQTLSNKGVAKGFILIAEKNKFLSVDDINTFKEIIDRE